MSPPNIVEFRGVCKTYRTGLVRRKKICALEDVSLSIPSGSVFGVIGPNRAGKTTLVKALLSLCRPTAGTILRLGRLSQERGTLAHVGYLHDSQALPRYLSATALLRYYGGLSYISRDDLSQRIPRLLEDVGLADRAQEPIGGFSKGMVQRLALAQALINDPELLVLDEPTEGMDLAARKLLHDIIARRKGEGKTTVLVSHSMPDVQQLCDRVAVLRAGRVVFVGSLAELTPGASTGRSPESLQEALEPWYAGVTA
jgi:ABC-2 type transport system ATP-binding protein